MGLHSVCSSGWSTTSNEAVLAGQVPQARGLHTARSDHASRTLQEGQGALFFSRCTVMEPAACRRCGVSNMSVLHFHDRSMNANPAIFWQGPGWQLLNKECDNIRRLMVRSTPKWLLSYHPANPSKASRTGQAFRLSRLRGETMHTLLLAQVPKVAVVGSNPSS